MKKSNIYIAALIAAAGLTACDNDFVQPPYDQAGLDTGVEANTTIEELKEAFTQDVNYYNTPIGTKENGEHYIVRGRVTSDTHAGNVYKKVCLEDATGGVIFSIDVSRPYENTPLGQEVIIDCTGMYYGHYNFGVQIGSEAEGHSATSAPARMPEMMWEKHITPVGIPDPAKVTVHEVTVAELNDLLQNPVTRMQWQGLLVKVKDVKFQTPGATLGKENSSNNSVYIVPAQGGSGRVAINTSGYSTLWDILCPNGSGDITAVLTLYGSAWQLQLNDAEGIGDTFEPFIPEPAPIYLAEFKTSQDGYTIDNVSMASPLTRVWQLDTQYGCMKASAYMGQSYASDSWIISPEIDLAKATDLTLSFDHCVNKFPDLATARRQVSVAAREVGGQWQVLTIPEWSTNEDWNFASSGKIDFSAFDGKKVQIGFRYTSEDGASGTWEVKNVALRGEGTATVNLN